MMKNKPIPTLSHNGDYVVVDLTHSTFEFDDDIPSCGIFHYDLVVRNLKSKTPICAFLRSCYFGGGSNYRLVRRPLPASLRKSRGFVCDILFVDRSVCNVLVIYPKYIDFGNFYLVNCKEGR